MSVFKKISVICLCLILTVCVFVACDKGEDAKEETSAETSLSTSADTSADTSTDTSADTSANASEETSAQEYVITYDTNGGTVSITSQTVISGEEYVLATPEKNGYNFEGWYLGEQKYESGIWSGESNVTLKASWCAISYNITYVDSYGSNSNPATYTVEDEITLVALERKGYTFLGWTCDGHQTPSLDMIVDSVSGGDKTYVANWQANTYTISYDANNGIVLNATQTVTYDSEYTLEIPVREGYVFNGWYKGQAKYIDGVWSTADDISLKADWKPISWVGNLANSSKISEDTENKSVSFSQVGTNQSSPSADFYYNGEKVVGSEWAISGTINTQTVSGKSGHIYFTVAKDSTNIASFIINRRISGVNGAYRNIVQDGIRTPSSGNEQTFSGLTDTANWTAEFVLICYNGNIALYLKEPNGEFASAASYKVDWSSCYASIMVKQYADMKLSDLSVNRDAASVKSLYNSLEGIPEDPIASVSVLFIGNSATSTHGVPNMLSTLAKKAGYNVTVNSVTSGGASLADHANTSTDHGKAVLAEISKGYDIVFIQEVTTCISSDSNKAASLAAAKTLDAAIEASGAKTFIYVRPPSGNAVGGYNAYDQCLELDKLFNSIATEIGATNAYVNRAFAYAIQNLKVSLWGDDNAHVSEEGAYLVTCVLFSTLFNTSSTVLGHNGLPESVAVSLQQVADEVVLGNYVPK